MEQSIFDRVTVNQDQFRDALFWQLSGQVSVPRSGWGVPKQSFGIVPAGVFETRVFVENQRETWNQAGWITAYSYQQFCFSQWLPLGKSFVYLPPERDEYELFFSPVRWVFNLTGEVYQFTGEWSERLRRIEDSIEAIESPLDLLAQELNDPGSPLNQDRDLTEGWFPSVPDFGG